MLELIFDQPIKTQILTVIDILLVSAIFYNVYKYIAHTRAIPVVRGIFLLIAFTIVSRSFDLVSLNFLLMHIAEIIVIVIIILFPSEVRRAFYKLGQTRFFGQIYQLEKQSIALIIEAIKILSAKKIGGIIIIERQDEIQNIADSGISIDGQISTEVIVSIFFKKNPLHDGAIVVRRDRITSAACIIPILTNRPNLSTKYGTRHRAAIGLSEQSDAFIIIVSEETGNISIAYNGDFQTRLSIVKLENLMAEIL